MNRDLTRLGNRLNRETNIESILALDEQIREQEKVTAKLKRARNSSLNISKLPPELLSNIFRWNVTLKGDFDGLEEGSHNFLLVCNHWYEVALSAPELWSYWGSTPKDWARRYHRSGITPLDLVLNVNEDDGSFDVILFDILQDRANRDAIRRVHLKATDSELLTSILLSLTAGWAEGLRSSSVESFVLQNEGDGPVDVTNLFSHSCFLRLQRLKLYDCLISSWDFIPSRITTLTTLDLNLFCLEPTPTSSQILSILASNPTLREVSIFRLLVDGDDGRIPSPRVSLHQLKELELDGNPQGVFEFLDRLEHPRRMDRLDITLGPCAIDDISHLVGPYLWNYLRHRGGSEDGLGLSFSLPYVSHAVLRVGDVGGIDFYAPAPARMNQFMEIVVEINLRNFMDLWEEVVFALITYVPREEVVYFQVCGENVDMEDVFTQLPNLRGLHFEGTPFSTAFPGLNLDGCEDVFPSLQYVLLDRVAVDYDDWSLFTTFLDRRASSGNRLHTLVLIGAYQIYPMVRLSLMGSVQEFACWTSEPTAP